MSQTLSLEKIHSSIHIIRGEKIIIDSDLASLYGVEAKNLNRAVKRNLNRFPEDFMFQLTTKEYDNLRFQFGTSRSSNYGGRRYLPYAFTEQGVAMLSSVLNSPKAIQVNIEIMRAFVKIRQMISTHSELSKKLNALERKYDGQFKIVFEAIRQLMEEPVKPKKKMGFTNKTIK